MLNRYAGLCSAKESVIITGQNGIPANSETNSAFFPHSGSL